MDNWTSEEMPNGDSFGRNRKKSTEDSSLPMEISNESATLMESAINGPVDTTLLLADPTVLEESLNTSMTVPVYAAELEATAGRVK